MKRETKLGGGADYLNKLESKSGQAAIFEMYQYKFKSVYTHSSKHIRHRTLNDRTHGTDIMKTRLYMELLSSLITGFKY